jgi:NAD(P)-dependent dehydrogenase (short-subunit alcohol dehydrogenase family)
VKADELDGKGGCSYRGGSGNRRRRNAIQFATGTGTPEGVAEVATLLASDDFAYVTGYILPVDGGFLTNMQKLTLVFERD